MTPSSAFSILLAIAGKNLPSQSGERLPIYGALAEACDALLVRAQCHDERLALRTQATALNGLMEAMRTVDQLQLQLFNNPTLES